MLKEFLEYVVKLGQEAEATFVQKIPQEPDHRYLLVTPEGHEIRNAEPAPRDHVCHSIPEFCSYLLTWEGELAEGANCPVVWFSRQGVTALLDDATRRDQVSLPLTLSPQVATIKLLEEKRPYYDQKAFISLLRIGFNGCLSYHPTLIDILRKVKFRSAVGADTTLGHGKESLGKSIQQQLTGEGTIPEEIKLRVPVFEGVVPVLFDVPCALEIQTAEEKFQLIPYPGAIEKAIRDAETQLGIMLRQELESCEGISCFYGQP